MKSKLIILLLLLVNQSFGAIIFFTDKPNSAPVDSDFFALQRNSDYINASVAQVRQSILAGQGPVTNNTLVVTNLIIQVPGGFTNLNLTPNTVMYADVNNAEASIPNASGILTNNGSGGVGFNTKIQLDEIDAQNFYPTNMYTFLTNAAFLKTDGDGKVIAGVELPGTNVLLSAGANIVFATNGSGGITISSSGTNTVDTSTNNLFVATNATIYKNLNLNYLTASKLLATDGAKNATNADVSARFTFTGNVLDIAAASIPNADLINSSITIQGSAAALGGSTLAVGSSPQFNGQQVTNVLLSSISSPTNGVSTASSIDFTLQEAVTNIAGAVSQTSLLNFNQTNINHAIRYYVNRTGSDQTITVGTWETDSGRQTTTTYICTNNTTLALMFSAYIGQFTNVTSYKTFR